MNATKGSNNNGKNISNNPCENESKEQKRMNSKCSIQKLIKCCASDHNGPTLRELCSIPEKIESGCITELETDTKKLPINICNVQDMQDIQDVQETTSESTKEIVKKCCSCKECKLTLESRKRKPRIKNICPNFIENCINDLRKFITQKLIIVSKLLDQYIDDFREILEKISKQETRNILECLDNRNSQPLCPCKCMQENSIKIEAVTQCISLPQYVVDSILAAWIRMEALNNFEDCVIEEIKEVIELCDHAITPSFKAFALYTLGCLYFARNEFHNAMKCYFLCIQWEPKYYPAYIDYSSILADTFDQISDAIIALTKAIRFSPNVSRLYINRGCLYNRICDRLNAYNDFCISIEIDPENPVVYNNRGTMYISMGRYKEAIDDFDKSIQLDSTCNIAYYNRGLAKVNLGKCHEALLDFSGSLQRKFCPDVARIYRETLTWVTNKFCGGNL